MRFITFLNAFTRVWACVHAIAHLSWKGEESDDGNQKGGNLDPKKYFTFTFQEKTVFTFTS